MSIRVFVTGGTNGIGKQIVKQLAQLSQYEVLFTARNEQLGNQLLQEINSNRIQMLPLDLMQPSSISSLTTQLQGHKIDVLVNNAGVNQPSSPLCFQTNILGPVQLTQSLLPNLLSSTEKKVVNLGAKIASLSNPLIKTLPPNILDHFKKILLEKHTSPTFDTSIISTIQTMIENGEWKDDRKMKFPSAAYLISKMALHSFTVHLSETVKELQLACVDPGWCKTNLTNQSGPRTAEQGAKSVMWAITTNPLPENGALWDDTGKVVTY